MFIGICSKSQVSVYRTIGPLVIFAVSVFIVTETNCTQCSAGKYCLAGDSSETACASGYYSLAGSGACTLCPAGSYCTLTTETKCPAGTYSVGEATSCTDCPAGEAFIHYENLSMLYTEILKALKKCSFFFAIFLIFKFINHNEIDHDKFINHKVKCINHLVKFINHNISCINHNLKCINHHVKCINIMWSL